MDVMMSICNLFLTPAQWALHTSLALWWRRWWRCFPAPGSTSGLADCGLADEGSPTGRGRQEGERRGWEEGGADQMGNGGKEEKEGEGSAEPQLQPVMFRMSVSRCTCPALKSDGESISTKISVFTQVVRRRNQKQFPSWNSMFSRFRCLNIAYRTCVTWITYGFLAVKEKLSSLW